MNITGTGNSASLVCRDVDPKIAEQVRAILSGTQRNEKTTKDISQKLDMILKEINKKSIHIEQRSEGPNSPNTVNINQRPPPRRIPPDKRAEIVALLKRKPAKVSVSATQNNAEAYQFAQDWYDVFKAAGWTMTDNTVRVFTTFGRPQRGILLRLPGETVPAAGQFEIAKDSPAEVLAESLETLKMSPQVRAQRYPDMPEDQVSFSVNEHPEN
ncbi:MAG TPA: hypothetical protein VGL70_03650 [Candidatus Binatia bacterium]